MTNIFLNTSTKTLIILLACILTPTLLEAQMKDTITSRWKSYINLDEYNKPFWKTDTIYDETVLPISEKGNVSCKLLYKASTILAIRSADYCVTFVRGKDWDLENGRLVILPGSAIPTTNKDDLVFKTFRADYSMQGKVPGTYVLFTEKPFFSKLQIAVTYVKAKGEKWRGPVPHFAKIALPNTLAKLKDKQALKVVFYGNSIEAGFNTSDHMNTPPYMPTWPELVIYQLRKSYGPSITFVNQAVPGKLASWGLEQVSSNVIPEKADLVIIGFGMNDGAANVSPEKFRLDIDGMIKTVLSQNPNAEFILIAPMLPNPDASQSGIQSVYKSELDKLVRKGVIVADMTAVHLELLNYKTYQDMTGNNVNHPNDYLARWYAQTILGFLIKKMH